MSPGSAQHFVYVYRDRAGNPAYFGQGPHASRPADDVLNSHNRAFGAWLAEQQGQHRLELIGPLESKEMADAIETALVSACASSTVLSRTLFNDSPGMQSPALLVGVTGGAGAQVVLSSSFIDRDRWPATVADRQGLARLPLLDGNVDALQLRGHSIAADLRLRFERARAGHFRIFDTTGFDHLHRRGRASSDS